MAARQHIVSPSRSRGLHATTPDDLGTFCIEGVDPLGNRGRSRVAWSPGEQLHSRDVEQIAGLSLGGLKEKIGEKSAPLLDEDGVLQRAGERFGQVPYATFLAVPHRCTSPLDKIDASRARRVCVIRATKRHPEIADYQERLITHFGRARQWRR